MTTYKTTYTRNPSEKDFEYIQEWLEKEFKANNYGLYHDFYRLRLALDKGELLVLKRLNRAIGYAVYNHDDEESDTYITLICIKPSFRGRNLGQKLYDEIEKGIDKQSEGTISLLGTDQSIGFWKKNGFEFEFKNCNNNSMVKIIKTEC